VIPIIHNDLHQRLVAALPALVHRLEWILRPKATHSRVKNGAVLVLLDATAALRGVQQVQDRCTWCNTRHCIVVDI
jgi:hypothetical protein